MARQLVAPSVTFGCDPEFFFSSQDGEVVGAEKVLTADVNVNKSGNPQGALRKAFVIDGVQVELNPSPQGCREQLASEMAAAFRNLRTHLEGMKGFKANFTTVVEISQKELDSLSEAAKKFGCAPSSNAYNPKATITADPSKYLKRSAGGHIHLGLRTCACNVMPVREELIPIMDILLGNTCVLLDRDPEAAERRKNYGRAGEFRLPTHGIEYRTLSNFWLRSYQLMSLVFGLSRLSAAVLVSREYYKAFPSVYPNVSGFDPVKELKDMVDLGQVEAAINTNDFHLASENFRLIKPFLTTYGQPNTGLNATTLPGFDELVDRIWTKGLEKVFPTDPMTHWCALRPGNGAENYLGGLTFEANHRKARAVVTAPPPPPSPISQEMNLG